MSTQSYGFAVAAQLPDLQHQHAFRRTTVSDVSRLVGDGVAFVARHYANTPEAVAEEQPFRTANLVLVYEGHVDNRTEIADALEDRTLAHAGDGTVRAAAYEAWGPQLAGTVIGEYAYLVFDRTQRRLVAGQDGLGVRRIYYGTKGLQVWITSNLALLFEQFPDSRPAFDRDTLREYFAGIMSPWSGRTIWRGIRELGRGKVLVQQGNDLKEQTAWQPDASRRLRFSSAEEVDEAFRDHLFNAVRAALRSSGPVLCDLSGGYDSSTVCSTAAFLTRNGEGRSPVVGWSYFSTRSNERSLQEAVQQQYGIDVQVLNIADHLPFQAFGDTEIPTLGFIQFGAVDRAMREFARSRGIQSRLTGYAGDALFGKGMPPVYLAEWLREGRVADWARDFAAYLRGGSYSAWQLLRRCTAGSLALRENALRSYVPDWLTPTFRQDIEQADREFVSRLPRVFSSDARELMYRLTLWFMPNHGRMLADERMPLVYRPLVEFVLALDWEHIVRPNDTRVLMRRALGDILPELLRAGEARGNHAAAIHEGLRTGWPRIQHLLTGEHLQELGVIDRQRFQAALEKMRAGYAGPHGQFLTTALYLEAWLNLKTSSPNGHVNAREDLFGSLAASPV